MSDDKKVTNIDDARKPLVLGTVTAQIIMSGILMQLFCLHAKSMPNFMNALFDGEIRSIYIDKFKLPENEVDEVLDALKSMVERCDKNDQGSNIEKIG